ncbi:E3 ubiquitin-protein ligase SINAT2 [Hibiscus syriacus]|uniref:RING-type E3 ubiquitin transferase n=1 Tax=Hibiscus syriacus TaxID=106335 RepID=A0A6A3D152_HIBSY|nr:E3 ubiquitin-protein ligase SINAT2 [Hibiscus syriacus]
MAPGGSACKEVVESHSPVADHDSPTKTESNTTTMKNAVSFVGKHGIHSNNGVYELLECPVCTNLMYPPIHQNLGCHDIFSYYSKLKHEQHCRFRPYNCPYAGSECSVTGDIPTLVAHLKDDHNVDMHDGCTFNHRYVKSNPHEVEKATWMLTVFNCFGRQFCLHFEAFQLGMAPVYMAFLRFMGDDNEAKKFSYSLEVGANGRPELNIKNVRGN